MTPVEASPRVSVVLCTYNGEKFLDAQLQSLAQQTLLPFELVVRDDASTDATISILERFRDRAPFPVLIERAEVNCGSTRNFDLAMQLARGELIALCDQDDLWRPEKLEMLAALMERRPDAGAVFSDAVLIDGNAVTVDAASTPTLWQRHGFTPARQREFAEENPAKLLLQHDVVTGATLMVRTDLRASWTPIPTSWVHDGWIVWQVAMRSRVVPMAETLIGYRIHGSQQLGVNHVSRRERLRRIRATERQRYAHVAGQFQELLKSFQLAGVGTDALHEALKAKVDFLTQRAELSRRLIPRITYILLHAHLYLRYARGWRSMRKDLFLF